VLGGCRRHCGAGFRERRGVILRPALSILTMRRIPLWLSIFLLGIGGSAHGHDPEAQAGYLGNAGVVVGACGTRVLFDAFFEDDYGRYLLVPAATAEQVAAGVPPYDGVEAAFVTHVHGDHFTPAPTLAYLRAHPAVRLYAPRQVADALANVAAAIDKSVLDRIVSFDLDAGDTPQTHTRGGLTVEVVAIPHSGGQGMADIQNLAYRVTLRDAVTVSHLGDATGDETFYLEQRPFWDARATQLAFVPYWLLLDEDGRRIIGERIGAATVVGVHVPADAVGQGREWRQQAGGDLFTDPGESRRIDTAGDCGTSPGPQRN
jgi:L-ascorbate metabolism protein UlaG (beta-lactamase superfamily)